MPTDEIVFTHSDCVCNEILALTCRHQAEAPGAERSWKELAVPDQLLHRVEPWSRERVVQHYTGGKRARFDRARESLEREPLVMEDTRIRMFLKADKYHAGEDCRIKAPRCIQFRRERYGLELGRYIHPIEKDVYQAVDASGTSVFAKSRNSVQRAADLATKAGDFADPVFLLLDQSNWDAHVNKTLLEYEHQLYLRKCPSRLLQFLLRAQRTNVGATKNGTKFTTPGTRMSGDMNTALGNCVINYALLYTWALEAGIDARFYIDGDDSVVVFAAEDRRKAESLDPAAWFLRWGMESKVDWTTEFEQCEFCQCRPVWDGIGWRMVRNPERFMIRSQWTVNPHHPNFFPKLVASIAKCEMACSPGVPIVNSLAVEMLRASGLSPDVRVWKGIDAYHRAKLEAWHPDRAHLSVRAITQESRLSMERAWGIPPAQQVEWESRTLSLSHTTAEDWATYLKHFAGDNQLA